MVEILVATAATVHPGPGPTPCASAEETERILTWLEKPEVRLVETSDGWVHPVRSAARYTTLLATTPAAPLGYEP
jgi:DNA polymerase-3 subunit epsilon